MRLPVSMACLTPITFMLGRFCIFPPAVVTARLAGPIEIITNRSQPTGRVVDVATTAMTKATGEIAATIATASPFNGTVVAMIATGKVMDMTTPATTMMATTPITSAIATPAAITTIVTKS